MPRTRSDPDLPPESHIPEVAFPYENSFALTGSPTTHNKRSLYSTGNENGWSVMEMLLCLRLYDIYGLRTDHNSSFDDVVKLISQCMRTREESEISLFLKNAGVSAGVSNDLLCGAVPAVDITETTTKIQRISKKTVKSTKKSSQSRAPNTRRPPKAGYEPCDHDGPCTIENGCSCAKAGSNCEKFCGCSIEICTLRYSGCRCKSSCTTNACPCYASGRECDPELCLSCGSGVHPAVISTIKKQISNFCSYSMCGNVGLRRNERKRVAIGNSDVQGWGLFILEPALKGELIIEYKGEVVSNEEAERRGVVYDKLGCSYLFDLNPDFAIDATRLGNAVKFMNHSDESSSNCFPEIKAVDGEQRIGLYARRNIEAGDELTFDYKYTLDAAPDWAKEKEPTTSKNKGKKRHDDTGIGSKGKKKRAKKSV